MDVTEEVALKRANFGGERYELTDFQRKVRENYDRLSDPSWVTVSADGTMEKVEKELYDIVGKEVNNIEKRMLGKLWVESNEGEAGI